MLLEVSLRENANDIKKYEKENKSGIPRHLIPQNEPAREQKKGNQEAQGFELSLGTPKSDA